MVRQGTAHFALGSFDEAVKSFDTALGMFPAENATRAKILNNLGVAHYQCEHYSEALKALTLALEIQRQWLDGPVVRESIVYDASVTLGNMGNVYLQMGDYDLSYFVFEEACLVRKFCCNRVFESTHNSSLFIHTLFSYKRRFFEKIMIVY